MTNQLPDAVLAIVKTFPHQPGVAAIALGGSRTSSSIDGASDYDIYVYLDGEIPLGMRRELAQRFDPAPEIGNAWFGPGDEWTDRPAGVSVDVMYWDRAGFERDLRAVIEAHRPSLGYSTAFWYTVRQSTPLFDRDGWFAQLQELAATPYPDELRRSIVVWNQPLLRTTRSSYRHQIELAIARDDPVSVQHRLTALLASVFDILFAVNRTLHPGEKRLLDHVAMLKHGAHLAPRIRHLIHVSAEGTGVDLIPAIDALCGDLDAVVRIAGLADVIAALALPYALGAAWGWSDRVTPATAVAHPRCREPCGINLYPGTLGTTGASPFHQLFERHFRHARGRLPPWKRSYSGRILLFRPQSISRLLRRLTTP